MVRRGMALALVLTLYLPNGADSTPLSLCIRTMPTAYCNLGYLKSVPAGKHQSLIRERATSRRGKGGRADGP